MHIKSNINMNWRFWKEDREVGTKPMLQKVYFTKREQCQKEQTEEQSSLVNSSTCCLSLFETLDIISWNQAFYFSSTDCENMKNNNVDIICAILIYNSIHTEKSKQCQEWLGNRYLITCGGGSLFHVLWLLESKEHFGNTSWPHLQGKLKKTTNLFISGL